MLLHSKQEHLHHPDGIIQERAAAVFAVVTPLRLMLIEDFFDLLHSETVQSDDPSLRPQTRRQDRTGLFLAADLRNEPSFMLPIHTPPIRMGQKMRAGFEENLDDASTRGAFGIMGNFH